MTLSLLLGLGHWLPDWGGADGLAPMTILAVFGAALLCEYMDSSLGMGCGTTLSPLLLIAGFAPMAIVPAVLLSELVTGVAAGLLHHRDGNIDLPNDPRARRTLALVAAFNKGLSGGGYGPLVTSGQVVSGLPARQAVVITSLAEAFTCLIGLIGYVTIKGLPDPALTLPLAAGALLSVPWATVTVRHLPESTIRAGVGVLTLVLGLVSLAKLLA